jgi:dTMP kinase
LVSIEGLNGVGKTYLTGMLVDAWDTEPAPLVLEEFSARADGRADLGRAILGTLFRAAGGDPFLRSGHPGAETLSLLAVKMFDYERSLDALRAGRPVLEGRSIHSTAVYQSLIASPDSDEMAYSHATALLDLAGSWRPLPDLTVLVIDDVEAAISRAERRDDRTYTPQQRHIHRRAAAMYARLALVDQRRIAVLDRRVDDADRLVARMRTLIAGLGPLQCLTEPWPDAGGCTCRCAWAASWAA